MPPTGTHAVIIGNGSSVDVMPPEFWEQDCLYIGTNRALVLSSLSNARLDAVVIRDTYRNQWADPDVGWWYHRNFWKPSKAYKVGPAFDRGAWCDEYVTQADGWQFEPTRDINREMAVMRNGSVIIMACNLAFHWGVRDFQLIGVDYSGPHAKMLEGYDVNTGNAWLYDKPVHPTVEKQFSVMKHAIESVGGSIVNHSPGSKLEAIGATKWQSQRQTERLSTTTMGMLSG